MTIYTRRLLREFVLYYFYNIVCFLQNCTAVANDDNDDDVEIRIMLYFCVLFCKKTKVGWLDGFWVDFIKSKIYYINLCTNGSQVAVCRGNCMTFKV